MYGFIHDVHSNHIYFNDLMKTKLLLQQENSIHGYLLTTVAFYTKESKIHKIDTY